VQLSGIARDVGDGAGSGTRGGHDGQCGGIVGEKGKVEAIEG